MANHAMLLVEGESDQKFFATLLKEMALDVQVQPETPKNISDKIFRNGINPLFQRFEKEVGRLLLGSSVQQLAIVIDADQKTEGHGFSVRRQQIIDILGKVTNELNMPAFSIGLAPTVPFEGELFTHLSGAKIGAWIMPDHASEGMVEDFLLAAIQEPAQEKLLEAAQNAIASLGTQQRFKPFHAPKAQLSTWLAWQDQPGISPAYAYYKELFDKNHPHLLALKTWLTASFA